MLHKLKCLILLRVYIQKKVSGEFCISVNILKKLNNIISQILSKLINQEFYEGVIRVACNCKSNTTKILIRVKNITRKL